MGRDKKAQRTKGNKQPSSSGRTADLLGGMTGLVGFSALQDLGYVPAASQCLGADESAMAASFRVALRKMMKKDATTKIKALQEFEALCRDEDQEATLSALPFWPRLYSKLSIDVERRVREGTQTAHCVLAGKVGRQLAPHLRAIMPSWVMGICDPHPPAATAAARAFQEAFSKEKRAEVILFSSREIVTHFTDMLFVQTPQTLSDPKTTAPEDMENKHIRILSCSLQGLSWVIQITTNTTINTNTTSNNNNSDDDDDDGGDDGDDGENNNNNNSNDNDDGGGGKTGTTATKESDGGGGGRCGNNVKLEKLMESLSEIVGNPGFWKLMKHKNAGVRLSWFDLVNDLLVIQPQVFCESRDDLTSCVLSSLDDAAGRVLPSVWTAFLHLHEVKEDWRSAKAARGSTNRVLSVLREGGRGGGGALYSLVPPVFSLLTPSAGGGKEEEDKQFYINFCRALSTGILKHPGHGSGGGAGVGVKALYQCLCQLATTTTTTTTAANCGSLWATLLEYQVVSLLEASFTSIPPLPSSTLYPQVAELLRFLSTLEERDRDGDKIKKEEEEEEKEKEGRMEGNIFSSLLSIFWEKFLNMCKREILTEVKEGGGEEGKETGERTEKEKMEIISRLSSFLRILRHPDSSTQREKRLRFAGEEEEEGKGTEKSLKISYSKIFSPELGKESLRGLPEKKEEEERVFMSATEAAMALLASQCHELYQCQGDHSAYTLLASIVQIFPCRGVYESILRGTERTEESEVTAKEVLERKVLPSLEGSGFSSVSSSSSASSLLLSTVEMFTSLYGHLEERERREVLQGLKPSLEVRALHRLVIKMTSRRHTDKVACDWLLSVSLGNRVVLLAEELCRATSGEAQPLTPEYEEEVKALLVFVLNSGGRRGPVVRTDTVSEILECLGRGLMSDCSGSSNGWNSGREQMTRLAACLADISSSHPSWHSTGARQFRKALFMALCECPDSATSELLHATFLQAIRGSANANQTQRPASRDSESDIKSQGSASECQKIVRDSPLTQALRDIRDKVIGESCTYQLASFLARLTLDLLTLARTDDDGTGENDQSKVGTDHRFTDTDTGSHGPHIDTVCTDTDASGPNSNSGTCTGTDDLITDTTSPKSMKDNTVMPNTRISAPDTSTNSSPDTLKTSTMIADARTRNPDTSTVSSDTTIPLDTTHVQTLLEEVVLVEGQWAALESAMSALYVAPSILKGAMAFQEFPFPKRMADGIAWDHKHHRASLFTCGVLLGLCQGGEEEDISLGKYTHLFVDVLHSACSAAVMMGHRLALGDRSPISQDTESGIKRLVDDSRKLLTHLNLGNKRLIAKQIRDRCHEGSSAWCVTLTQVLSHWLEPNEVNTIRLLQGLDHDALGYTATKQALLLLLPQSSLLEIMEEEAACLTSLSEEPFSAPPCLSLLSSTLALLPSSAPGLEEILSSVFSILFQWRERADGVFLFAADLQGVAWEDLAVTCAVVKLVSVAVASHAGRLTASDWDFVLCCLSSWVQSLQESLQSIQQETVAGTFTYSVCCCVKAVADLMAVLEAAAGEDGVSGDTEGASTSYSSPYPPKLLEDWVDFFAPPIYDSLINIFVGLAAAYKSQPSTLLHGVCSSVSSAVVGAAPQHLARHSLPPIPAFEREEEEEEEEVCLPKSEETLLRHLVFLLTSPHPAVQGAAYCLLTSALPALIGSWDDRQQPIGEDEELPVRALPQSLTWILRQLKEGEAGKWGAGGELPPHSPLFPKVVGYLLGWRVTFNALSLISDANQHQYCAFLRDKGHLPLLLYNLFTLMPLKPLMETSGGGGGGSGEDKSTTTLFNTPLNIRPAGLSSPRLAPHLACQVYYSAVSGVPAVVRQWFLTLDRSSQAIVDAFTSAFVSPILVQQEMSTISGSSAKFDNMTVRCRPGAREVVALYTVDEARMELVLRLAPNHPLGTVTVEDHKRIGVSLAQWRNWLLGLTTMLSHHNTPLLRSLAFWKQNVDQKFKGLEECYICYYVIHGTNHQLPKLLCRTCKKKFHSACLYKWFNSSNNSTCPLCRSLF